MKYASKENLFTHFPQFRGYIGDGEVTEEVEP